MKLAHRLKVLTLASVHHDDSAREFACDCKSSIGRLDEAKAKAWTVVS
jgi:hypothetical protein